MKKHRTREEIPVIVKPVYTPRKPIFKPVEEFTIVQACNLFSLIGGNRRVAIHKYKNEAHSRWEWEEILKVDKLLV